MTRAVIGVGLVGLVAGFGDMAHAQDVDAGEPDDLLADLYDGPDGLTAADAARRAGRAAPSVRRAELGRDSADEAVAEARAGLVPRIDLTAGYTRLSHVDQPPFEFGGTTIENPFPQILDSYLLRAAVSLPVSDLLVRSLPAFEAAQGFAEASRHQVEAQRRAVAFRAEESLYRHLQARGALAVAQASVALLDAHLERISVLVEGGMVPAVDRSQIEAQLESARVAALRAEAAVEVSGAALRRQLGMEDDSPLRIGEPLDALPEPALPSRAELVREALAERPEARALHALAEANDGTARAYRAGTFPSLSASAQVDYANPNPRTLPQEERFTATWQVGLAVRWSPNDALTSGHRADQASLSAAQAREDLLALEDAVRIEAADAIASARVGRQAIVASERGVAAAQEAYDVEIALHEAGLITSNDVLDAETALRRAQLELVQAHVDYRIALARIEYVAGRTPSPGATR